MQIRQGSPNPKPVPHNKDCLQWGSPMVQLQTGKRFLDNPTPNPVSNTYQSATIPQLGSPAVQLQTGKGFLAIPTPKPKVASHNKDCLQWGMTKTRRVECHRLISMKLLTSALTTFLKGSLKHLIIVSA